MKYDKIKHLKNLIRIHKYRLAYVADRMTDADKKSTNLTIKHLTRMVKA